MAELEEGQVIGPYRVVRCIGQGGRRTVCEVEHVEIGDVDLSEMDIA